MSGQLRTTETEQSEHERAAKPVTAYIVAVSVYKTKVIWSKTAVRGRLPIFWSKKLKMVVKFLLLKRVFEILAEFTEKAE